MWQVWAHTPDCESHNDEPRGMRCLGTKRRCLKAAEMEDVGCQMDAFRTLAVVLAALVVPAALATAPAQAQMNWQGCYVGPLIGLQYGTTSQRYGGLVNGVPNAFVPTGTDFTGDYDVDGYQAGGTLGCSYQIGALVIGIEGDASKVNAAGYRLTSPSAVALGVNSNFEFTVRQTLMATARGRIGYAWDRWLIYATGGLAFGTFELNNQNRFLIPTATRHPTSHDETGWVFGLGGEYALVPGTLSVKLEGLYADFGSFRYGNEPGTANGCTAGCANADVKMEEFVVRLGVNIKLQ